MSFEEEDEVLNLAIKASLEQDLESASNEATYSVNNDNEDDQFKKAIEASLIENQKQNDELFNSVIYESLDTFDEDETILEKAIEESHLSNFSVSLNTDIINSSINSNIGSIINMNNTIDTNDSINTIDNVYSNYNELDDYDEEEYMKMVIQQIKESEELENKLSINKSIKSIIEEQDFEYEEALRQDIEKEKKKEIEKTKIVDTTLTKLPILPVVENIPDLPKTKEEMRKLRLAFFDKK